MRNFKVEDTIIYEDRELIVCHKPAGIAVQNARLGVMDMESALKNYLAASKSKSVPGTPLLDSEAPYLAVVHRLDQPVEGVLVFAKTAQAARELSRQTAGGEMDKKYLAVTSRMPEERTAEKKCGAECEPDSAAPVFWNMQERLLRDYLKKDGRTNMSAVVPENTPGSKEARLTYRVLQEIADDRVAGGKRYLVEIHLETGRHHQIRVQMAHAGMPLLGDRKYHSDEKTGFPLGLCSCELRFVHPRTKKKMKFEITPKGEAFGGFECR